MASKELVAVSLLVLALLALAWVLVELVVVRLEQLHDNQKWLALLVPI